MAFCVPMLSYLRNGPWATEKQPKKDYTLTICGPNFSGKTTLFCTLSKFIVSGPWVTRNSSNFNYRSRSFQVFDIAGDGLGHRSNGLDVLKDCINPQNGIALFIHDAVNGDLAASITLLHRYVDEIIKLGGRFLIIVLNKQDTVLPATTRSVQIRKIRSAFEAYMTKNFGSQIYWQVHTFDGFSGKSEVCSKLLLSEVISMMTTFGSFKPQKRVSAVVRPVVEVPAAEEESLNSRLDSETFWQRLKAGSIVLETHVDRLRATYLTVLNAVENGQGMLELVEEMQAMEERRSIGEFQRHRWVPPQNMLALY